MASDKMAHLLFTPSRELLLIEIERRCSQPACRARTRIGLTKQEAIEYHGFRCERYKEWTEDVLAKRDVPEWWDDLPHASESSLDAQIISYGENDHHALREETYGRKDD
jgi:hypothetical protein